MLTVTASQAPNRPSLYIPVNPSSYQDLYSDSRTHGYQGNSRTVRIPRATSNGGGTISKSEDGTRCIVAGRESLRILRVSDSSQAREIAADHKFVVGRGGARIESSRNFWEGSGLKIDSAITDVAWAHGAFSNKVLTSARNGELIMWDLNKSGNTKYERRIRDHTRSIHKLSYSHVVQHYCLTGSADGDVRIWDLRDLSKSVMKIHHPTGVRTVAFSPSQTHPLHTVVGLDNGSIYRWDLKMGQRGQIDRLPVAHAGPILALNWFPGRIDPDTQSSPISGGWVATGGLDRCVKIWDFNSSSGSPYQPIYTLHTSFAVRRILWRPSYECELAVVSNADFGTGSNELASGSKMPSPRITERNIGDISGSLDDLRLHLNQKLQPNVLPVSQSTDAGDAVEIWDVRRQHIPKWIVKGSAVEGGVTDITFGDSHSLWAQHSSGAFSQLDVRHSVKPLDAVPRVAMSWEVSGTLVFVSDRPPLHEIPYDDVDPSKKQFVQDRKIRIKKLGDPPHLPQSQNLGSYTHDWASEDVEGFIKLARGYVLQGGVRSKICGFNAGVALDVGKEEVADIWTLLESLLTDLVPLPTPPLSPLHIQNPGLPHSLSAPAAIPSINSSPSPRMDSLKTSFSDVGVLHSRSGQNSPARHHAPAANFEFGTAAKLTPSSSAASSPQRISSNLPTAATYPAIFARRKSGAGLITTTNGSYMRPRMSSSLRRPSMSAHSSDLMSVAGSVRSHSGSLKHVGEGALDDSDSSGEEEDDERSEGDSIVEDIDEEPEPALRPLISPYLMPRNNIAHPSPLSRLVKQQNWPSDGEEERNYSPSPASSDSEGDSSGQPSRMGPSLSRRRSHGNKTGKTRSRSSTVASLAASSTALNRSSTNQSVTKKESRSSIRTVTAGDTSLRESDISGLQRDDTIREFIDTDKLEGHHGHKRHYSEAVVSEFLLDGDEDEDPHHIGVLREKRVSARRKEAIAESESRFRELGWEALREALETFADEGDIQMCAMLAIFAPKELHISRLRAVRFFESYIDTLSRLRLHTSAAYIRKYVDSQEVRANPTLQLTIYTSCGRCRKPITIPSGPRRYDRPSGGYAYCLQCQSRVSKCSICHLPVKALLFQCPVCMHGGHQKCYREYYTERPMVDMPPLSWKDSGVQEGRARAGSGETLGQGAQDVSTESGDAGFSYQRDKMLGHPCAAGCGHYCWAVMEKVPFP